MVELHVGCAAEEPGAGSGGARDSVPVTFLGHPCRLLGHGGKAPAAHLASCSYAFRRSRETQRRGKARAGHLQARVSAGAGEPLPSRSDINPINDLRGILLRQSLT